jgi:hypothetical protein
LTEMRSALRRAQQFQGLRRHWLAAIDAVGRGRAGVLLVPDGCTGLSGPAPTLVAMLTDTRRVILLGDEDRPRLCASVFGGMVARFLPY